MKKIIAVVLSCTILFSSMCFSILTQAADGCVSESRYSQDVYDGFRLEWSYNGIRDILLSASKDGRMVTFQYDQNWNRTSKIDSEGNTTYFNYDMQGRLVSESRGEHTFAYCYNDFNELTSITIDEKKYKCILMDKSVHQLLDENGCVVVEYSYCNGLVDAVYEVKPDGELIDRSRDVNFVGNLNKVTFKSYYYDSETGWYYGGRFYDVVQGRYIDGQVGLVSAYLHSLDSISVYNLNDVTVKSLGDSLAEASMNDSTFGIPYAYYASNWFSELKELEIASRLIYGENPYQSAPDDDRIAIGWVVWNRLKENSKMTLRDICTASGQFATITGVPENGNDPTKYARVPDVSSTAWECAVNMACYVYAAKYLEKNDTSIDKTGELEDAATRPKGITSQTFFRSYGGFKKYTGSATNIALAGYGSGYTKQNVYDAYQLYRGGRTDVNIYFN